MNSKYESLIEADKNNVWHPYSSMVAAPPVYPVVSASGVMLRLADGKELIDGMSSWWCAIHGYNHPVLNHAVQQQLEAMSHVMFGGLTHEPAVALAGQLVSLTPEPLQTVFFADSGSVAVEVAIKMALQYWLARGYSGKNKLLTIRGGYHGDTFGAMGVCDPVTGMHSMFSGMLAEHLFADRPAVAFGKPWSEDDIDSFRRLISGRHEEIAAVILEPIVQGAGGMWFYSSEYLQRVRELCNEFDILLILDEIATGFGRTGKLFACQHADVVPDIMCLGKALTGGYMSLAATLMSRQVTDTVSGEGEGVFMHGPTFMANPLACSAALASIDLLLKGDWQQSIHNIELQLQEELAPCRRLHKVKDVRVLGAIGVVELDKPVNMHTISRAFVDRGVWIRPFGRLVYLMPPYIIESEDLYSLTCAMHDVLRNL
jgi:adenosylmethionine-8-amino-7-oxononanoate aminotransferase